MAVGLSPPDPAALLPVPGVRLGVAEAGIRKANRKDLLLVELAEGSRVAAVFTRNRFCAAPVLVSREHRARAPTRAWLVNTGIANAGTGDAGLVVARGSGAGGARAPASPPEQGLPFSPGVIPDPLPIEPIERGLPVCAANLAPDRWADAAQAIMTTDTVPKAASRRITIAGAPVTLTGIAKGAGMIRPDMATLLAFLCTDADIAQPALDELIRIAVDESFNAISVDGDTSTNDSFVIAATARAGHPRIDTLDSADGRALSAAVVDLARELACAIVRDGEGATKFITIDVRGGRSREECRKVAYAIAHSPLVKTAFFASDPNLGRILCAIGYAGVDDLDVQSIRLWLDDVLVAEHGGRAAAYTEAEGQRVMRAEDITVRIDLARGSDQATVWTCDLSYDYVKINAEYRS